MRHLKLMREENLADHDTRKSHRIVGVRDDDEIAFERLWDGRPHITLTNRRERGLWQYFPRGNTYFMDARGDNITSFAYSPDLSFYYDIPVVKEFITYCTKSLGVPKDLEYKINAFKNVAGTASIEAFLSNMVVEFVRTTADFFCPNGADPARLSWECSKSKLNGDDISALLHQYKSKENLPYLNDWLGKNEALAVRGPDFSEVSNLVYLAYFFNEACASTQSYDMFVRLINDIYHQYRQMQLDWCTDLVNGHQY